MPADIEMLEKKRTELKNQIDILDKELEIANAEVRDKVFKTNFTILLELRKNPSLFKLLLPNHSCKSCNNDDVKLQNTYLDHGVPRCKRCYFLAMFDDTCNVDIEKFKIELDCFLIYK